MMMMMMIDGGDDDDRRKKSDAPYRFMKESHSSTMRYLSRPEILTFEEQTMQRLAHRRRLDE
jgi:hypothetical protein